MITLRIIRVFILQVGIMEKFCLLRMSKNEAIKIYKAAQGLF